MLENSATSRSFPPLSVLRPTPPNAINSNNLHSGALLSPSQVAFVKEWFRHHPNDVVCRALKNKQGEISNRLYLKSKFSVLYDRKTQTYWVVYYGKMKNKLLGEAGEGSVKYAQNMETLHWHALKIRKIIPEESRYIHENFFNEYYMLKKIGRNAYRLNTNTRCYLILDLVPGENILKARNNIAKLNDTETIGLILKLLLAYIDLANRNIIHRDLKPDNIMIDVKNNKVTIIDFGYAITKSKIDAEKQKKIFNKDSFVNRAMGSPPYIHPETLMKAKQTQTISYNDISDIYGLLISIALLCKVVFSVDQSNPDFIGRCFTDKSSPFFNKFVLIPLLNTIYGRVHEMELPPIKRLYNFFVERNKTLTEVNTQNTNTMVEKPLVK